MEQNKRTVILCNLMLLTAAFVWGISFIFQKDAANYLGPATVMCARYIFGTAALFPFIIYWEKKKPAEERVKYDKNSFKYLVVTAALFAVIKVLNMVLNQAGLGYTTAGKTAFLTASYVVMVPFFGLLMFKYKTAIMGWIGTFIGIVGIYFMSITENFTINTGDLLVLASSVFAAIHINLISKIVHKVEGRHFLCMEFVVCAIYCGIWAVIFENPSWDSIVHCLGALLFAGVLGTGLCYALQVTAQKYTDPTITALILTLESPFGAIAGVIVLGEAFTGRELFGALLLFAAVIIAQFKFEGRKDKKCKVADDK